MSAFRRLMMAKRVTPYNWAFDTVILESSAFPTTSRVGVITTDYIEVIPSASITVQAGSFRGILFNIYKDDKSYEGSWRGLDYEKDVTSRTVNISSTVKFIRASIKQELYGSLKVWQNGVLIFDGAEHPL